MWFSICSLKSGGVPQLGWRFLASEEEFGGYNALECVGAQQVLCRILCQTYAEKYGYESANRRDFSVLHGFVLDKNEC